MATETNRNAIIGSIKAFIERSPILGVGHPDKDTISLFNLLVNYEDLCTAQYEDGKEDYLALARQLKSLSGDLKRKCPAICNYTQRIVTDSYKDTNIAPTVLADNINIVADTINYFGDDYYVYLEIPIVGADSDGRIHSVTFNHISGPGFVSISTKDLTTGEIYGAEVGVHTIQVTVVDNEGASTSTTMTLTITAAPAEWEMVAGVCGAFPIVGYFDVFFAVPIAALSGELGGVPDTGSPFYSDAALTTKITSLSGTHVFREKLTGVNYPFEYLVTTTGYIKTITACP